MITSEVNTETKQHLSDIVAVSEHILEAVNYQLDTAAVKESPEAHSLLNETQTVLARQVKEMEMMSAHHDTETRSALKKLFSSVLGNLVGAYNQVRGEGASRAMRDTYTALCLLQSSLLALKTFGLMVKKPDISKLAYDELERVCRLLMKINAAIPYVVAREVAVHCEIPLDMAVPQRVETSTQKLWNK